MIIKIDQNQHFKNIKIHFLKVISYFLNECQLKNLRANFPFKKQKKLPIILKHTTF